MLEIAALQALSDLEAKGYASHLHTIEIGSLKSTTLDYAQRYLALLQ